ncbi:MAG: TonB-dependent receptor [Mediterranea sp.]|jgi:TonB-linked SusC/RagA family outer membrane protein|nr:TonB-dependent receptor [Mediterranea sp.]
MLLLLFPFCASFAQTINVKGVVKDSTGEPVIGASVVETGTTNGIITDFDGNFTLQNVPSHGKLTISFIGYQAQTIDIAGRTQLNVIMKDDTQLLDEVVVVGYGTQRKSDVTGAIASVGEKTLKEVPAGNVTQALQGRVAGVTIAQTSTRPGQTGQIRIRGSRSLTASNDPLIVVDGIPFEGTISDINPGDIKSIDILKDASATAIYGSRGANGVLLVTTQRGASGSAKVSYNGSYGIKSISKKYEVFNAEEFVKLRQDAGYTQYMPQEEEMIRSGKSTDWQDLIYQDGYVTQHEMSVSGGADKGQYSLGLGYYGESAVLPGQDFIRYSLRASIDQEIGKYIKVGLSTQNNYSITDGESASFMYQLLTLTPIAPAYNDDGSIYKKPVYPNEDTYNPLLVKDNSSWIERRKRFSSFNSLYGEVKFTDYLKYRANVGLTFRHENYGNFYGSETPFKNGTSPSSAAVQNSLTTSWAIENLIYYDKTFNKKHKVSAVAMFSAQETEANQSRMNAEDLAADFMQYYNLGYYNEGTGRIEIPAGSQWYAKNALLSYMFRANYAYDSRYMLTLTGRYDGASVLASSNQWHAYPAVSVAWNITNEEWAKGISNVDMLKLRGGYGQTANQAVSAYSTLGSLSQSKYSFNNQNAFGYYVSALPNPDLGWEYTNTYNLGLDYYLFDSRISGSIEWYTQHTYDLLLAQSLPPSSGVPGSFLTNVGETKNVGMEFTLSGEILKNTPLKWTVDANLFFNKNEVVALSQGVTQDEANSWFVGEPIDVIYDYKKIGIWQLGEESEAAKYEAKPGDVRLEDLDKDNRITEADRQIVGKFSPDFEGGITSRMTYKNFDLTVVGFFRVGGILVSAIHQGNSYLNMLQGRRNQIKVDYWTPTNPTNEYPSANGSSDKPTPYGSTIGLYDAGFLKIRSMSLGYNFTQDQLKKVGLSSARVYFTAQNPFTFFSEYMSKGNGVDPESTGSGSNGDYVGGSGSVQGRHLVVGLNTPPTRNFLLGLNIGF